MLVQRMKSLVNDLISEEGNESEDEGAIATKGSNTTTTTSFPSFWKSLDYKRLRFPFYSQSISEGKIYSEYDNNKYPGNEDHAFNHLNTLIIFH